MITRELPSDNKESCIIETVVEDNGIGMSEEFQKHAFDIFARERNTTESHVEGTGLGLAITKRLIDMLGEQLKYRARLGLVLESLLDYHIELEKPRQKILQIPIIQRNLEENIYFS